MHIQMHTSILHIQPVPTPHPISTSPPSLTTSTHPSTLHSSTLSLTFQPTTVSILYPQDDTGVFDDPLTEGSSEVPRPSGRDTSSPCPPMPPKAPLPEQPPPPPTVSALETAPIPAASVVDTPNSRRSAVAFLTEASAYPLLLFEAPLQLHLAVTVMLYVYYSLNPWSYLAGLLAGFFIFYFAILSAFIVVVYHLEEAMKKELDQQSVQPVKHKAFEETKLRIQYFEVTGCVCVHVCMCMCVHVCMLWRS